MIHAHLVVNIHLQQSNEVWIQDSLPEGLQILLVVEDYSAMTSYSVELSK